MMFLKIFFKIRIMKKICIILSLLFVWTCGGGGDGPTEPVPQLPTVQNIEFSIDEDTSKTFAFMGLDPINRPLTYSISSQPQNGTIVVDAGSGTYTPNANFNGADTFYYIASNVDGVSNIGTIVATIVPVDDKPSTLDVNVTTDEDNDVDIQFDLTEVDGDNVVFSVSNYPSNGSVTISGNNAIYSPNQHWHGTDQFNFQVEDASARKILNTATATIVVNSVDDVPVANNITETMDENRSTGFNQSLSITLDASDADGDDLTYIIESGVSNGSLQSDGTSTVVYTPNQDYNGVDTFTYKVNDGYYDSNTATVTININSIEDVPVYNGETFDWYITIEYGIQDTFKFALPSLDGDGDSITWYMDRDNSPFSFNDDQSEFFVLGENLTGYSSYEVGIYGIDDKGNQGSTGITTLNIYGGASALMDVIEVNHEWEESNAGNNQYGNFVAPDESDVIRDVAISYIPYASLSRTGLIIESSSGLWNQFDNVQDFDQFNYWTQSSLFDIELDFSTPSLAWNSLDETLLGYVPFSAYIIDNFSNEKTQLFIGYAENDEIEGFSHNRDKSINNGPNYGATSFEPIYLFWHKGSPYNPSNESFYISQNNLRDSGGCGWGDSGCAQLVSDNVDLNPIDINNPIFTGALLSVYLSDGQLPTENGHNTWGSGWTTASSYIFDTELYYYDTPQGDNDGSSKHMNLRKDYNPVIPQLVD